MTAKAAAAIIAGPIASPSSPSVRLTAFDAPVITSTPNGTKNQPRFSSTSFRNGTASVLASDCARDKGQRDAGDGREQDLQQQLDAARHAVMRAPGQFPEIVEKPDQPEPDRDAEHDPDIRVR